MFTSEGREMVGQSNNYILIFLLEAISLLTVTKFYKVLKMSKNWAKLRKKFDKN
jgi:hypothetical protein